MIQSRQLELLSVVKVVEIRRYFEIISFFPFYIYSREHIHHLRILIEVRVNFSIFKLNLLSLKFENMQVFIFYNYVFKYLPQCLSNILKKVTCFSSETGKYGLKNFHHLTTCLYATIETIYSKTFSNWNRKEIGQIRNGTHFRITQNDLQSLLKA